MHEGVERSVGDDDVVIFTDGGCRGNPGPGAWAAVILARGGRREITGVAPQTTNNRMELMAAIEALGALKGPSAVTIVTDSEYLRRGITEWMKAWIARGWRTANRKSVRNRDLWEKLDELTGERDVTWRWVRGHSGDPENERCDSLLNEALDDYLCERG